MKQQRLKQFGISLIVVLSLSANLIAVCACSHHFAKGEVHADSCHQMTMDDAEDSQISNSDVTKQITKVSEDCHCFSKNAQPLVNNKLETFKAQKHAVILPALLKVEIENTIAKTVSVKSVLTAHFYNSNYLSKLTPARAPPAS